MGFWLYSFHLFKIRPNGLFSETEIELPIVHKFNKIHGTKSDRLMRETDDSAIITGDFNITLAVMNRATRLHSK